MADTSPNANRFAELVEKIVESYHADPRTQHLDSPFLPNRAKTIEIIELMRRLVFPGFFDEHKITSENVRYHVGELLDKTRDMVYGQVRAALRYEVARVDGNARAVACDNCDDLAEKTTHEFLARIPDLRRLLSLDVQAAFEGDPASVNTDENIFCYPGLDAIFVYRVAHVLHQLEVPMLPRIMTEYAHNETGIDIHPGAEIGESFFIDHGTGVVIGETTQIGHHVKVYQGVTLGALSTKGGQAWRGRKRHPTVEDEVTIYGGAIILGGETVIGRGSTIGGSVFLTQSVPPHHTVTMKDPELAMKEKGSRKQKAERSEQSGNL